MWALPRDLLSINIELAAFEFAPPLLDPTVVDWSYWCKHVFMSFKLSMFDRKPFERPER